MIKPLRKKHRQVWMLLAIVLPAGILLSWLAIPNPVPVTLLNRSAPGLLPIVKYAADKKEYKAIIRTNQENTEWQLEWKNKLPLTVPSAVIYQVNYSSADITRAQLIGRIETRKNYVFTLSPELSRTNRVKLMVYDFIHERKIDYINF